MEILRIINLAKNFYLHNPGLEIKSCQNINLTLNKGEFIGIVGLSGAGKSTILKCVNRSYLPMQGGIIYESEAFGRIDLATATEREILYLRRNEIGYVSQFLNVMPRTTAKEHVMNALIDMGMDTGIAEADARSLGQKSECLAYERIFCQTRQVFEGIIALFRENLTKYGGKYAIRQALGIFVQGSWRNA